MDELVNAPLELRLDEIGIRNEAIFFAHALFGLDAFGKQIALVTYTHPVTRVTTRNFACPWPVGRGSTTRTDISR